MEFVYFGVLVGNNGILNKIGVILIRKKISWLLINMYVKMINWDNVSKCI